MMPRRWIAVIMLATLGVLAVLLARVARANHASSNRDEMLRAAQQMAHLAELPPHAVEARVAAHDSGSSRTFIVKFQAPAEELEAYIATSPALKNLKPIALGNRTVHLPFETHKPSDLDKSILRIYFQRFEDAPWFNPEITIGGRGRRYRIPSANGNSGGYLIVNDDTLTVFYSVTGDK